MSLVDENFRQRVVSGGKKVYAVHRGYRPGLYYTWPDCKVQVRGFLGAEFQGFKDIVEAKCWLQNHA